MNLLRVLIADDHTLVRQGLRSLLEKLPHVDVVGEVQDGASAVEFCTKEQPELVLMDIAMPGLNGLDASLRITQACPSTKVLLLSMHANEEYLRQAFSVGAAGYLLKGGDIEELELALNTVSRGDRYVTTRMAKYAETGRPTCRRPQGNALTQLTSRQREVLQLIAEGASTKQIASRLQVSIKTVETHRMQLMRRLAIQDVAGLVRFAIRHGLVMVDQ